MLLLLLLALAGCGEAVDAREAECMRRARAEVERRVDGPLVEQELRARCLVR